MYCQQSHGVGVAFQLRHFQPPFLGFGGFQPAQERIQVNSLRGLHEGGCRIGKGVEVAPGVVDACTRLGGQLNVKEHGPLHHPEEIGKVLPDERAQHPQFVAERQ